MFPSSRSEGTRLNNRPIVEVPLDDEYITAEGMYIAGYIWGKHVRSTDSAPKDAPEDFIRGVEDGYGDALTDWDLKLGSKNRKESQ